LLSGIQLKQHDRKADWAAVVRINCYFKLWDIQLQQPSKTQKTTKNNKTQTLAECDKLVIDTTHLKITPHNTSDIDVNCMATHKPCEPDWVSTEYESQPWYAKAPTKDCTPCGGESTPMGRPSMGRPSMGVSSHCTMENGWYKVVGSASCMLGKPDGTPLVVDYTKKKYTTYAFTIKLGSSDGNNAHNGNIGPHGAFKPCNLDSTSSSRGRSPELWFIDRNSDWGWGTYNGEWGHSASYHTKDTSSDPNGKKELHFEVSMKWESNRYTIHSWKVADDKFPAYNGKVSGCNPSSNYAFTPRLWVALGSTFYMKNLIVSQSETPPTP